MRHLLHSLLLLPALWAHANTVGGADEGFSYKSFSGSYAVYGGDLGDLQPPTATNKKIAFKIERAAAKEMFEGMGPDVSDACAGEPGERTRIKENLICTRSKKGEYACYFGFDLKSGKSIAGQIC